MSTARQYVFGYASLLDRGGSGPAPIECELHGYRRTWNVAMDNSRTIAGYKHYLERATGVRGRWFVTFLNIVRDSRSAVNGVAFEVTPDLLEQLDERERNYTRVDISAGLSPRVDGTVWTYTGTDAARGRFREGRATGRAVVSREYYEDVRAHFRALGPDALRRFTALTDEPDCPVIDLRRVDHPRSS